MQPARPSGTLKPPGGLPGKGPRNLPVWLLPWRPATEESPPQQLCREASPGIPGLLQRGPPGQVGCWAALYRLFFGIPLPLLPSACPELTGAPSRPWAAPAPSKGALLRFCSLCGESGAGGRSGEERRAGFLRSFCPPKACRPAGRCCPLDSWRRPLQSSGALERRDPGFGVGSAEGAGGLPAAAWQGQPLLSSPLPSGTFSCRGRPAAPSPSPGARPRPRQGLRPPPALLPAAILGLIPEIPAGSCHLPKRRPGLRLRQAAGRKRPPAGAALWLCPLPPPPGWASPPPPSLGRSQPRGARVSPAGSQPASQGRLRPPSGICGR